MSSCSYQVQNKASSWGAPREQWSSGSSRLAGVPWVPALCTAGSVPQVCLLWKSWWRFNLQLPSSKKCLPPVLEFSHWTLFRVEPPRSCHLPASLYCTTSYLPPPNTTAQAQQQEMAPAISPCPGFKSSLRGLGPLLRVTQASASSGSNSFRLLAELSSWHSQNCP